MKNLSCSKLPLFVQCQYFARPETQHVKSSPSPYAVKGTAVHACIAQYLDGDPKPIEDTEILDLCVRWQEWFEDLKANNEVEIIAIEPRFCLFPDGQCVMVSAGVETEIALTGSPDLIAKVNGKITIFDWKTGVQQDLDPADSNAQIWSYALMAQKFGILGTDHDCILALVKFDPSIYVDTCIVSIDELKAFEDHLFRLIASINDSAPNMGRHCKTKYCTAVCGSVSTAISEVPAVERGLKLRFPIVQAVEFIESSEHAAHQFEMLECIDNAMLLAKEAVKQYISRNGPIKLMSGKFYGKKDRTDRKIIIDKAKPILEAMGLNVVKETITQTSIEEAMGSGKEKDRIMRILEDNGAVEKNTFQIMGVVKL
jgi:hypothetical protein